MKLSTFLGYFSVFIGAVLIGYWIGIQISRLKQEFPQTDAALSSNLAGKQVTLLVIHVDRIQEHPNLRVIWLAAMKPGAGIKLVPIYPITHPLSVNARLIRQSFSLGKDRSGWKPVEPFFQILKDKGLSWNGFIVLDDPAVASLVKATGEIRINGQVLAQDDQFSSQMENEDSSFQLKFWQDLCWNIANSPQKIDQLEGDFIKHILIGLTSGPSIDWHSLISNIEVPLCEFPYQLTSSD